MEPLFSKIDSNELLLDVQYKAIMIRAKFGADLFNILKLQVAPFIWAYPVYTQQRTITLLGKYEVATEACTV